MNQLKKKKKKKSGQWHETLVQLFSHFATLMRINDLKELQKYGHIESVFNFAKFSEGLICKF